MASQNQPERRVRRRNNQPRPLAAELIGINPSSQFQRLGAGILDISETGIKVQTRSPLARGSIFHVETRALLAAYQVSVTWCRAGAAGQYHVGMAFDRAAESPKGSSGAAGEEDFYEILQVNPKATPDTIHRVYRILAQRHHPDNQETGSEEAFKQLTRAYQTLFDHELRTAYDLRREQSRRTRVRIFESLDSTQGKEPERRKRAGVLNALYARRAQDPDNPALSIFDFEELLGVPRDHLEFTLWYLKERTYVARSDNNRFQITANGVDYAESMDMQPSAGAAGPERLLSSA